MTFPPVVLSIAGSDPSGGAGIQADLKTATALGVYGAAAITSLTVQSTRGVSAVHVVPADFVAAQAREVLSDLRVGAIKIGMLATEEIAGAVAEVLDEHRGVPVVLDPVMVATSGDRLVTDSAVDAVRDLLLPRATVITPNLPETGALLARRAPASVDELGPAAAALRGLGARAALVKGGHLAGAAQPGGRAVDVLADADGIQAFDGPWVDTPNTHGTGCTLSSAIASRLALGDALRPAIRAGREYLAGALLSGATLRVGHGPGPVDHLWREGDR